MSPRDAFGRGQTVLVLGGGSDIGQAIAARMVEGGARTVILAGRSPSARSSFPAEASIDRRHFDARDTASHGRFFDEVFGEHSIDTVVVAFGVLHDQASVEADPLLGVEMAETNYVGALSALLLAVSHLRRRGSGDIVLLSSVAGNLPRRSNFVYGSSKTAIDFAARGLAAVAEEGDIHLLIVRPGFVRTSMTAGMEARPFAVSAETVARAVTDGLARRDRVVWVPGILRWVMGVLSLLPRRLVDLLES